MGSVRSPKQKAPRGGGSERLETRLSELAGLVLAEREGFEPSVGGCPTPDFESGTFDHSATSPLEAGIVTAWLLALGFAQGLQSCLGLVQAYTWGQLQLGLCRCQGL